MPSETAASTTDLTAASWICLQFNRPPQHASGKRLHAVGNGCKRHGFGCSVVDMSAAQSAAATCLRKRLHAVGNGCKRNRCRGQAAFCAFGAMGAGICPFTRFLLPVYGCAAIESRPIRTPGPRNEENHDLLRANSFVGAHSDAAMDDSGNGVACRSRHSVFSNDFML
jgi:hypothetical protein